MAHSPDNIPRYDEETWASFDRISTDHTLPVPVIIGTVPSSEEDDMVITTASLLDVGEDSIGKWVDLRVWERVIYNARARQSHTEMRAELLTNRDNPNKDSVNHDELFLTGMTMQDELNHLTGDTTRIPDDSVERCYLQSLGRVIVILGME